MKRKNNNHHHTCINLRFEILRFEDLMSSVRQWRIKKRNLHIKCICHALTMYESSLGYALNGWQLKFTHMISFTLMCLFVFITCGRNWRRETKSSKDYQWQNLIEKRFSNWITRQCIRCVVVRFFFVWEIKDTYIKQMVHDDYHHTRLDFSNKDKFLYVMCVLAICVTQFFMLSGHEGDNNQWN